MTLRISRCVSSFVFLSLWGSGEIPMHVYTYIYLPEACIEAYILKCGLQMSLKDSNHVKVAKFADPKQ